MCVHNTANRVCGHSPPLRPDGTVLICHQTAFRMLAYLVQHNITPGNASQRLFAAQNNNEWNGLLKSINLYEAYCAAQKAQKGRQGRGKTNNRNSTDSETVGEYRFCLLVCAEVEERLKWAVKQWRGGGERLLWQEAVTSDENGGKRPEWRWNARASRDRNVLMDWFHAGMENGKSLLGGMGM